MYTNVHKAPLTFSRDKYAKLGTDKSTLYYMKKLQPDASCKNLCLYNTIYKAISYYLLCFHLKLRYLKVRFTVKKNTIGLV